MNVIDLLPPWVRVYTPFIVAWIVSAIVIMIAVSMTGGKSDFILSLIVALVGSLVFGLFSGRLLYNLIAIFVWLLLLKTFFKMSWFQAIGASILSYVFSIILQFLFGVQLIL
ncbi:MAG: hypothetical protein HA495_04480 [Thaumarchaeota archaeon]|jgi:hypothetical protein|nr:hypothetical protein [Nitrososphaerota archaeon]